ncbi:MAG: DUF3226 domain-containing protein [Bdellovibrionota bacterium]
MNLISRPPKKLFVEGSDDEHVITHLINALRPGLLKSLGEKFIETSGDDSQAIKKFNLALKQSTPASIGIVIDADDQPKKQLQDRWEALQQSVQPHIAGDMPKKPPFEGWVCMTKTGLNVGIWIMPDNTQDGAIEKLLTSFVPEQDILWPFALEVVEKAKNKGAKFRPQHEIKAQLHTWLAWSEEPGRPYGRAITCGDFIPHGSQAAEAFAKWFETLFVDQDSEKELF